MENQKTRVLLNRSLFMRRPLQATSLTTLTTLIHRFQAPDSYELFIRRDGSLIHRAPVQVADGGVFQINIDMAGSFDERYTIAPTGALGFYVSSGEARYSVTIDRIVGKERKVVLDSSAGVPAGDLFAVTLVRPGRYRVTDAANKIDGVISVEMPAAPAPTLRKDAAAAKPRERFRSDVPTSVQIGRGEIKPKEVRILAGQTVVFDCTVAANLRIEPLDEGTPKAQTSETPGKLRRTFKRG
jgi:hypothetical protein